jgi:predicted RNA binding protein YcfA (HicA-like mRNA interferase family)
MKRSGHTPLTVPVHHGKDLAKGTLWNIIKESGFSLEMFKEHL